MDQKIDWTSPPLLTPLVVGKQYVQRNGVVAIHSDDHDFRDKFGAWSFNCRHPYDFIREHVPPVPARKEIFVNKAVDGTLSAFKDIHNAYNPSTAVRYVECPEGFPAVIPLDATTVVRTILHAHQRASDSSDSGWGDMSYAKGSYNHLPSFQAALKAYNELVNSSASKAKLEGRT